MKNERFSDDLIKFEALTSTPLKEEFGSIGIDRQLVLSEFILADVKRYAKENGLPVSRETWDQFKKDANWRTIAKLAIAEKSLLGKMKKSLDKMNFLW